MQRRVKYLVILVLMTWAAFASSLAVRADVCAICGQPIYGTIYTMTDKVTGERIEVCSNCCFTLPQCDICGLPIKKGDEIQLPDGRYFCARDAKTVVIKTDDAEQICAVVKDDLDHIFSRFTSFPTNVEVTAIDHIDAYSIFQSESPDLLGCTEPITDHGPKHYKISLMTGLPLSELKETCAHEYSHTWVGENVPAERHRRIARDAEEGFCEMVGYLYMDSLGDEKEKKRVLANTYTRGQVALFVQAEQQYGFDDVLDWMRYGVTSELEAGHLDEIRDVKMPAPGTVFNTATFAGNPVVPIKRPVVAIPPAPATIKLEGIMWGKPPSAIINGHTFFVDDVNTVKLGGTNTTLRCVAIQQNSVRIQNLNSGKEQELNLPKN
jgi:hypothetical protein